VECWLLPIVTSGVLASPYCTEWSAGFSWIALSGLRCLLCTVWLALAPTGLHRAHTRNTHTYARTHVRMHAHAHTHKHTHIHTHAHTHTHIHTHPTERCWLQLDCRLFLFRSIDPYGYTILSSHPYHTLYPTFTIPNPYSLTIPSKEHP